MIFKGKKNKERGTVQNGLSFSGSNYDSTLETLEVHEMGASTSQHSQEPRAPDSRSIPFSRRKAIIVSSVLTGVVLLFTGVSSVFITRTDKNRGETPVELTSDLTLRSDEVFGVPEELQGSEESLVIKGDLITQGVIKISNGGNVMIMQATNLTASRTFNLPDVSGTFCTDANNCNYAGLDQLGQLDTRVAQLGQQLSDFELTADSGVTSLNNQTGVITIQGSTNRIQVNTAGGVITLSTPQDLDANANVQFGSLAVSTAGVITGNTFAQTSMGNNVSISAGNDAIVFMAGGRSFQLPVSGPGSQTICTDGAALCATGPGEAVLLSDGAAQSDTDADASIFINDTGGGHLIRLQSTGVDRLVVDNLGNTTVGGSLTVSALGNGFVRSTAGALSVVSAIDLASSDVTNTLPVNRGGTGASSLTANGVLTGNGTSPVTSITASGANLCLVSTTGAPTFATCPGVSSINGQGGSITLQGTANQVNVSTAAGVITLSTPQDINTSSSPTFAALTLSGLSDGVMRASAGTLTTGLVSLTAEVSGTLPVGNGGTGLATTPTNGQLLIGNGTNYTLASLTQGAGIAIANGAGSIMITSAFGSEIDLGTETAGDYVSGFSGGAGVNVTGSGGEGSTPTIALILQASKGLEVDGNGLSLIDCAAGQILKYNISNQWVCSTDTDTTGSFNVAADSGTPENVANGDTLTVQGGNNITTTVGATDTITIATVNNPTFTTSVTTPLLQSSGALSITPSGALTVGATGQTALLQGSTTTITSNGLGNDIVLTSADQIRFSGFDCTAFANGGTLTTDASGNISCTDDNGAAANTITGTGTTNRIALYTGAQTIADSWLLQNGSTLELDNTRNLTLNGGNFSVTGTGLFTGLITANGGITVETGDTFTFNGEAFTDLTGTGLTFTSGSLQTTLGTSVDLTSEVVGILPVANGGTGINGSTAANGTLLIGNGTGYTLATLTAGSGITVNNSAGGIEIVNFFGTSIESAEITDLTITGADIADDTIALGTKTTGNYIATITGNAQVGVSGSGSETAAVTLSLVADSIGDTHLAFNTGQHLTTTSNPTFNGLTLSGNLAVDGGNASVGTALQAGTLTLSDGSSNTGTLQTAGLGQNTAFTLPDPGAAAATICLSTGNCAGAGGGVTTSGGTANRIAIFNGAQTVADSWLLQNGSTLQLDNTRNLELLGGNLTIAGNQTTSGSVTFSGLTNGFLEVNGTGVVAVGTIDLGADTAGNYVATITAGNGISGSSNTEIGTPTIALSNLTADWIQSGAFDMVLNNAGAEIRILENGLTPSFYGTFDVGDLSSDQTYTFLQGGDVLTSGNVNAYATTGVTAGSGLTGGGTTGVLTLNIGAGSGITVNADDIAVVYGSAANTAVQGNTQVTVTAGTNLTGGGTITLGAGGTLTVNVADSPTFAGSITVQGGSVTVGTATQAGTVGLSDGSSNTGTLQTAGLGQNTAFTLPDPGAAAATICLSTGNCAGAGGGVTTSGGTANRIAMFNGGQTIADSWLLQNGSTLQLDNTRNLELVGGNLTLTSGNLSVVGNQTTSGTVTFSALANGFLEVNGSGVLSVGAIDLGADTTGNYVATITAGNGISGSATGEGSTPTIALGPLTADWVQSGAFDIVLNDSGAEMRILESGLTPSFYGTFDVGDLSADQTYTFLQGGTIVSSGNVSSFATTGVTAGNGLTGGGTTGVLTLDIGAGNGITVNANDIAVIYGSTANTAVQGNTSLTVTAGTNLSGGGSITLGAGGTVTLNVADSPTFAGTVTVQGSTVRIGTASTTTGSLDLYNATSTFAGSIQVASLGQATLYTLPDPGAATATICLSTGNCAGSGSGVTTAGGTANRLAKFNGAQSIADSTISDDGTNVTTSVDIIIQGGDATLGSATQAGRLVLHDGTSNTASIVIAPHALNYTYTIPDAGANDEFCIRALGNCSGAGGGNAPNSAQYLTLALDAGLSAERTLSFNGTNFTVSDGGANGAYSVNTVQNIATTSAPSFAGLTLTGNLSMGTNTIQGTTAVIDFTNFDVASTGAVTAGTYNGQTISATASFTGTVSVAGLTTLNGGLTIETGDTLTVNGDGFTDLTGSGLQVTLGALNLAIQANKGLEVDASGLSLIDCANGEVLKYNTTGGTWGCATDAGAAGTGDDVYVNGTAISDGANFSNTAASSTAASTTWSLATASSPDAVTIAIGAASGTDAGILTAGAQTLGGAKTFNGQITAGAGVNLGTQTLQGTTAVIDFNNFDVSSAGAVTAVGVNAGSGLLQGTGGLTVAGTITLSGLTNGFLEVNGTGVVSVGTIDLGTDTAGNYVATITSGNGISAAATGEASTPTIALSNLTADWLQSGAFDIVLDNSASELKIKESGLTPTFYAILDTADLAADQTFMLNEGGTVVTSGNIASYATTGVTAGTGLTGGGTVGALTLNVASANGGIVVNANDIALTLQANKGLEVDANGLSLVDCANGEILKYNTTGGTWGCAADAGAAGTGDDVLVNGTNADGANFLNTTASASVAGVSISLNAVATPDEISLQISDASGTLAGIVTANAQTFGGNKTFNGQIVAGAGINIGATTLSGTTAVIDFNNFDVSSTGAVTAVGVNAGSGLIQGTGGITIAGTTTLSSLTNGFLEVNGTGVVSVGTIDLGTDTAGNYVATITAGNGISGSATGEGSTPTIALSNLTADWIQSGAFDIALANASSELKIMESVGGTFYAILDTADLAADQTFTLNQGGTVVTSGNVGLYATTGVTAGSGLTGGGTVGALTLNIGAGNGVSVAADSITLSLQANKGLEVDANGLSLIDCATDGYVLKYSTGTSQWACAADSDTDTTLTEAQVEGYIFDTDNVAGATSIAANANGINMLTLRRNTDTSPTGNFLSLQNAAAANLFNIDINGTVTAGTWQGSEIADAYISNSLTIASTGSVDWAALTNYPTGCAAGMAVTTIGDSLTCGSFLTAEADTLASVTGRGATTATASSFTGGATLRGLTVDTATATDDLLLMSITAGGATRFNGTITNADLTANRTYTLPDASGTLAVSASGNIALSTAGNITFTGTLPVANGGTGATTHTAGGILFGNGTSAFTNSGVLTNGQLLIGDGTGAPTVGTLTAGTGISITNGAGTITVASTITDTNTTYSAGNDLDLTGTTFDIESQLDFVSVINQTSANLTLQTTTSGNILLNAAGNVGVGDTTPDYKLEVQGSSGSGYLAVSNASDGDIFNINSSGNVGIGDATPVALFTVGNGDLFQVNSSGAIAAATGITTSGAYTQSGAGANTFSGASSFTAAGTALTVTNNAVIGGNLNVGILGTANTVSYLCRNSSNQIAGCNTTGTGAMYVQGGNSFGAAAVLGTNDANSLSFETNNSIQLTIADGGVTTFKNSVNSTSAVRIQNSAGTNIFAADTTNNIIKTETIEALSVGTVAQHTIVKTLESANSVGWTTDIELGQDGFPRIVHFDNTNFDLRFLRCLDASCNTFNVTTPDTTATPTNTGWGAELNIAADGFGRISHVDYDTNDLRFTQCTNADCSTAVNTSIDTAATASGITGMALASDGFARIVYTDISGSGNLKFIQCTNASCSTNVVTTLDSAVGTAPGMGKIGMGTDGFAQIAYYDSVNDDLKFIHCTNAACTTRNAATLDSAGDVGARHDLAVGTDGFARIAYVDYTNADLKYIRCTNADCTANVITVVESESATGDTPQLKLGTDGLARIVYNDYAAEDLKYARCTNADCTTSVIRIIDSIGSVGDYAAIALDSNSYPSISYFDRSAANLKFARLTSESGDEVISGASVGTSTAAFGEVNAKGINLMGGLSIDNNGRAESAIKVQGGGVYFQAFNAQGGLTYEINENQFSFRPTADSYDAFNVMNSTGSRILTIDTASQTVAIGLDGNGKLAIGDSSPTADLEVVAASNALTDVGTSTNYLAILRNENAVNGYGAGLGFTVTNTDNNIGASIIFERTSTNAMGNLRFYTKQTTAAGADPTLLLTLGANGNTYIGNTTDDAVGNLLVVDTKNTVGDPTGANGGMYYNSNTGVFRCYQNGIWVNCIGGGGSTSLQQAYDTDADGSDAIITQTAADDSLIFRNPASGGTDSTFVLRVEQLNTGAKDGLVVTQAGTGYAFRVNDDGTATDSTPFVIDSGGNVGVGKAVPEFKLHVQGADSSHNFITNDAYGGIAAFQGRRANGTAASPTVILGGDALAQFSARGYDGTAFTGTRGAFVVQAAGNWSGTSNPTALTFQFTPLNSTTLTGAGAFNEEGALTIAYNTLNSQGAKLRVYTDADARIGAIIQGTAAQTADLLQLKRDTLNVLTVSATGSTLLQNSTDSTTGFRVLDADGGVPVLSVDTANERVGIGYASPNQKLHVLGGASEDVAIKVERGANTQRTALIVSPAGTPSAANPTWGLGIPASSADFNIWAYDGTTDTNRLTILNTSGHVGVGDATPDYKMEIQGSSGSGYFAVTNSTDGDIFAINSSGTAVFGGNVIQVGNGVNALGDQESMVPNAGFEVNEDATTTVADGWTFTQTTGTPAASINTTSTAQGANAQSITATTAQSGRVTSACMPVTGGATYKLGMRVLGSVGTTGAATMGMVTYTNKSDCINQTSGTASSVRNEESVDTSYQQYGVDGWTMTAGAKWARMYLAVDAPDANVTVSFDSIHMTPHYNTNFGIDIAENFPALKSDNLLPGELVSFGSPAPAGGSYVTRSTGTYDRNAFGVVTTKPGLTLDDGGAYHKVAVALTGRVPVKVNGENGAIAVGDPITASSVPGVGMKATVTGKIIGTAVTAFDGTGEGTITVLINPEFYAPPMSEQLQGNALSADNLHITGTADITTLNVSGTATINTLIVLSDATIEGVLTVQNLIVKQHIVVEGHYYSEGEKPLVEKGVSLGADIMQNNQLVLAAKVEIDGTDTAGTITIVAGENAQKGALGKVMFNKAYDKTPRIVLSAINEDGMTLPVFTRKVDGGFEIVTSTVPVAGKTYQFDYVIIGSSSTTSLSP